MRNQIDLPEDHLVDVRAALLAALRVDRDAAPLALDPPFLSIVRAMVLPVAWPTASCIAWERPYAAALPKPGTSDASVSTCALSSRKRLDREAGEGSGNLVLDQRREDVGAEHRLAAADAAVLDRCAVPVGDVPVAQVQHDRGGAGRLTDRLVAEGHRLA